jgi:hypothetical protein
MQRKILNVYLYRDHASVIPRFKMRMIEMQSVDAFPPEMDTTFLQKFSGIEPPFALCFSDELDKYNAVALNSSSKSSNEPGSLFQSLSDGYTREVIRSGEECYIYQDIDFLLFAEAPSAADECYKGNDHDLLQTLGVLEDAVAAFRKHADNDKYEVRVNLTKPLPDFSKKLDILHDAFEGVSTEPVQSVSRHAVNWLINTIHQHTDELSPSTTEMADFTLNPILVASEGEDTLKAAIRNKLSHVNPGGLDTPRPLRSSLFAENLARSKREIELVETEIASLKL